MQIGAVSRPPRDPKCKSCLPPTLQGAKTRGSKSRWQNGAPEASKLAIPGLDASKIWPFWARNPAKTRPAKGKRGIGGPKIDPKIPFCQIRGGGPERPKSPQSPIFSGSTAKWAGNCIRSKVGVCGYAAEVSSSSCALS